MESHRRFKEEHGLPFPLGADIDKRITMLYGVRRRWGFGIAPTKRVTYVIDKAGLVRGVHHHEMEISRHFADVLEDLQRLSVQG